MEWHGWRSWRACARACVRKLPNDDKMLMPPPPPPKTDGVRWRSAKVSEQSGASVRPLFSPAARVVSGQQQPRSPKMAAAVCNVACIAWHRLGHVCRGLQPVCKSLIISFHELSNRLCEICRNHCMCNDSRSPIASRSPISRSSFVLMTQL